MAAKHSTAHANTPPASRLKPHSTPACSCTRETKTASSPHPNPTPADTSHCPMDELPDPQPLYPRQHSVQSPYPRHDSSTPSALQESRSSPSRESCSPSTYVTRPASPAGLPKSRTPLKILEDHH